MHSKSPAEDKNETLSAHPKSKALKFKLLRLDATVDRGLYSCIPDWVVVTLEHSSGLEPF